MAMSRRKSIVLLLIAIVVIVICIRQLLSIPVADPRFVGNWHMNSPNGSRKADWSFKDNGKGTLTSGNQTSQLYWSIRKTLRGEELILEPTRSANYTTNRIVSSGLRIWSWKTAARHFIISSDTDEITIHTIYGNSKSEIEWVWKRDSTVPVNRVKFQNGMDPDRGHSY